MKLSLQLTISSPCKIQSTMINKIIEKIKFLEKKLLKTIPKIQTKNHNLYVIIRNISKNNLNINY